MRVLPNLAVGLVLAAASSASADGGKRVVRLCAKGQRELPAAEAQLKQLDQAIAKAAADAPSAPLVKQLEALLTTPCFQLAETVGELDLSGATTLALKRWWKEGGHEWLTDQLSTGDTVSFPPSVRPTLSIENSPKHRLARLLCRAADATCGLATAGWTMRAEEAFRDRAKQKARWRGNGWTVNLYARSAPPKQEDNADTHSQTLDVPLWQCANPTKGRRDFESWSACVRALRHEVALFPAGAMRAPTSGWLVIRGRRGHYQFCDQLTAYDLATGAYYASKSCSGLVLQGDGSVDAQKTDAARTPTVETGRVSVDNLREAAWMIFLVDELDETGYEDLDVFPVPPTLKPKAEYGVVSGRSYSAWGSSAQTTLSWTWVDGAKVVAEGKLTWPDSSHVAEDYAVDLLRVVEAGLVPGCPTTPLPNPLLSGCGKGGVSAVDSSAASLCKVQAELSTRLAGFTCTKQRE
ncbi:MAG: hypothetical protein SFX73_24565 [Kofleriaceae bacterium]|nr:hypothetical protein [Kofleriaceae bacterium]